MKAFDDIYRYLPQEMQDAISDLFARYRFTESQKLEIVKNEADLRQWKEKSYTAAADYAELDRRRDGRKGEAYVLGMRKYMERLRKEETDYSSFFPSTSPRQKQGIMEIDKEIVLGRCPCPVDGEKTRCCNLRTMDPVEQCAFSCSYCSVQSFYSEKEIRVVSGLERKLLDLQLDPEVWHIGTGQASDSLFLGDDHGTLSSLSAFALKHPDVIIELKSKSARNVFGRRYPPNLFFSWSLNAPTMIEKEEHLTASLPKRLEAAERARDNGSLVGFHIHPMIFFRGWDEEYPRIAEEIEKRFSPENIYAVSIGTLTFTKAVIRKLRQLGAESRVLEMELAEAAGKFSYPLETKRKMFGTMFRAFSDTFRDNVFFYLCMEDPSLWNDVLGREYACDRDFENDMKKNYMAKLRQLCS